MPFNLPTSGTAFNPNGHEWEWRKERKKAQKQNWLLQKETKGTKETRIDTRVRFSLLAPLLINDFRTRAVNALSFHLRLFAGLRCRIQHQDHAREPVPYSCLIQKAMVDGRRCVGPLRRFSVRW